MFECHLYQRTIKHLRADSAYLPLSSIYLRVYPAVVLYISMRENSKFIAALVFNMEGNKNNGKMVNPFSKVGLRNLRYSIYRKQTSSKKWSCSVASCTIKEHNSRNWWFRLHQLSNNSGWSMSQQQLKAIATMNSVDELHEFVKKRNTVHEDFKKWVLETRSILVSVSEVDKRAAESGINRKRISIEITPL